MKPQKHGTAVSPVLQRGAASAPRLVSPATRTATAAVSSGVTPRGPRRSPWSTPKPTLLSPSRRHEPREAKEAKEAKAERQAVLGLLEPFKRALEAPDAVALRKQCALMASAVNGLQVALGSEKRSKNESK